MAIDRVEATATTVRAISPANDHVDGRTIFWPDLAHRRRSPSQKITARR
jgi:hypothetical protein